MLGQFIPHPKPQDSVLTRLNLLFISIHALLIYVSHLSGWHLSAFRFHTASARKSSWTAFLCCLLYVCFLFYAPLYYGTYYTEVSFFHCLLFIFSVSFLSAESWVLFSLVPKALTGVFHIVDLWLILERCSNLPEVLHSEWTGCYSSKSCFSKSNTACRRKTLKRPHCRMTRILSAFIW